MSSYDYNKIIKSLMTWYQSMGLNQFYHNNTDRNSNRNFDSNLNADLKFLTENITRVHDQSKTQNLKLNDQNINNKINNETQNSSKVGAPLNPGSNLLSKMHNQNPMPNPQNNHNQNTPNLNHQNSLENLRNARKIADKCKTIDELEQEIRKFNGCELKKTAINTVFADGNRKAKIMLVGEGPGAQEDQQGIPFCGQSGKLLDNMFQALGLNRDHLYITNTVFWRPPGNRRPTTEELLICKPFLEKHIALVSPKLIVMVGSTAVEALLNITTPMGQLRGQYFDYENQYLQNTIKATAIFHPSYLLRQQKQKKLAWYDLLAIAEKLELIL